MTWRKLYCTHLCCPSAFNNENMSMIHYNLTTINFHLVVYGDIYNFYASFWLEFEPIPIFKTWHLIKDSWNLKMSTFSIKETFFYTTMEESTSLKNFSCLMNEALVHTISSSAKWVPFFDQVRWKFCASTLLLYEIQIMF